MPHPSDHPDSWFGMTKVKANPMCHELGAASGFLNRTQERVYKVQPLINFKRLK